MGNHLKIYKQYYKHIYLLIFFTAFVIMLFNIDHKYFTFSYWGNTDSVNRSEITRNLGLVIMGIIAITITVWRGFIAASELNNSKLKLSSEKLHKAVELLESNSERNKISALLMLSELIEDTNSFHEIIYQILYSYLGEYSSLEKEFYKYKDIPIEDIEKSWYHERKKVNYSVLLCFEHYLKLINENNINYNWDQLRFVNLNLHGLNVKMPNCLIQRSDLSSCFLYCGKNTSFSHCDLTNAVVYPYKNKTLIFNHCNISDLRLNVADDINPIINGWHWEGKPPTLNSMWSFVSVPEDRRVIIMSSDRIISKYAMKDYYRIPFNLQSPHNSFAIFEDSLEFDNSKQKIIPEIEYNKLNKKI